MSSDQPSLTHSSATAKASRSEAELDTLAHLKSLIGLSQPVNVSLTPLTSGVVQRPHLGDTSPSVSSSEVPHIKDHNLWVRLRLNGAEVKRRLSLILRPGAYRLVMNRVSPQARGLRVLITRGDESVLSLTASLSSSKYPSSQDISDDREEVDPFAIRTSTYTRFDHSPPMMKHLNHAEEQNGAGSQEEGIQDGLLPHLINNNQESQRVEELEALYRQRERAIESIHELKLSWISEPTRRPEMGAHEWREGLDLLEFTLNEHQRELERLELELPSRIGEPISEGSEISSSKALRRDLKESDTSGYQSAEISLEVDQSDEYHLEVSYQVSAAAWGAIYRARLTDQQLNIAGTKPRAEVSVSFEMSARFAHSTGEEWSDLDVEFSLDPSPREDFPQLSYPSYERLSFSPPQGLRRELLVNTLLAQELAEGEGRARASWRPLLTDPLAPLTHLFSDQATMTLTLELELSAQRPRVEIVARGKLDTLLPIAGGTLHRFIGDEWLGASLMRPTTLGEPLFLKFGEFEMVRSLITSHSSSLNIAEVTEDPAGSSPVDGMLEELSISLHNISDQVRTLLLWQDLSRGSLLNHDPEHSGRSAPVGWVLSADRKRLMRWISLPPQRREQITLTRRLIKSHHASQP